MAKGRRGGIVFVVAAALALSGSGGGAAARLAAGELPRDRDGWIQVKSANFLLFSDAGERRTRKVAEDLEEVRSTLGQLSPHLVLTAPCGSKRCWRPRSMPPTRPRPGSCSTASRPKDPSIGAEE
jgi:hypothetical protein